MLKTEGKKSAALPWQTAEGEEMNRVQFEELLRELAELRPFFVSERDLQVSLAMLILKRYPKLRVRPEYCPALDPSMHIDLMVFTEQGQGIPVELKYRTRRCTLQDEGRQYTLKEQSARDLGCYLYMKDLERLERLVGSGEAGASVTFLRGFALMITNDKGFVQGPKDARSCSYGQFSLTDGQDRTGTMGWGETAGPGTRKGNENALRLSGTYRMNWQSYSSVSAPTGKEIPFFYQLQTVERKTD